MRNCLKNRLSGPSKDLSVSLRLPRLPNEAELASKNPKLFAQIISKKLQKVVEERADDSILSDHIERVMKTPQAKAPLLMLPSITRASLRNLQKKTKLTFSNFGKSASASQLDTKVKIQTSVYPQKLPRLGTFEQTRADWRTNELCARWVIQHD